jgi:DNA gyrase subunit A
MRVVIELKKGARARRWCSTSSTSTPQLQATAGIIMLALVNNQPRGAHAASELLYYFIEHRAEVVERRTRFDLRKAEERAHILEGLLIALDHIDEVIAIIRAAADTDDRPRAADRALRAQRARRPTPSSPCACAA